MRPRLLLLVCVSVALAACSSSGSETAPATTPPPLVLERTGQITLSSIQPDDGIDPVIAVIDEAKASVDIAVYQMDPSYSPLIEALTRAKERGVKVRILLSRTIYPPGSTNDNPRDVEILKAQGFDAALSRPEFSFSHWKLILTDAGTERARALICDFNLEAGYFGIDPQYPNEGDTRGMAVLDTDPKDVDMIARTFEAEWPPYAPWPANDRPNLVWSPSDATCDSTSCASPYPLEPTGNSRNVMLSLIGNAQDSLDVYAQALAEPSQLLQPLIDAANRGVNVRIVGNDGGINSDALAKLRDAGAEIVINPTDPTNDGKVMYIHTKTIVADSGSPEAIAFVGSINPFLDESIDTERELGVLLTDPASIARIVETFNRDFASGTPS